MFAANATIDTLMTPARFAVAPTDAVAVADTMMRENGVHHLVVLLDGALAGIVSALDVLRIAPPDRPFTAVNAVMTAQVETLRPSQTVRDALDKLASATYSALPVVDASGEVLGIVTTSDLEQLIYSDY
jgi:CBS domain-containing protein